MPDFTVLPIDFAIGAEDLRKVRETVFVREQSVPAALERDGSDPACRHVIARDATGAPIGAGRLTPDRRIGRMAVLREWRGRGVGDALLAALLEQARAWGWAEVSLHAQVSAEGFYARHGFVPQGGRFMEAGIEHQAMRRVLHGVATIDDQRAAAVAITVALAAQTRRSLVIYSRDLDPGLFDAPSVLEALRRLATRLGPVEIRVLLHDASAPQRALAPLLPLAQRLPSVFAFREIRDPVDRAWPSAYVANDTGGWYFRPQGHRLEGEARLDDPARARQLQEEFTRTWERARLCTLYRALEL